MDVKRTCPLGSECETAKDGTLELCRWYVQIEGQDPQNGERVNERRCAMEWLPILMIEGNGVSNHAVAAIHSLRNESVTRQDAALEVMKNVKISSDK